MSDEESPNFQFPDSKIDFNMLKIKETDLIYEFYDGVNYKYSFGRVETLKEVNNLKNSIP